MMTKQPKNNEEIVIKIYDEDDAVEFAMRAHTAMASLECGIFCIYDCYVCPKVTVFRHICSERTVN